MDSDAESCPWCGAAVEDRAELCLNCMRAPAAHPSHARQGKALSAATLIGRADPAPQSSPAPWSRPGSADKKRGIFSARFGDAPADSPGTTSRDGPAALPELELDLPPSSRRPGPARVPPPVEPAPEGPGPAAAGDGLAGPTLDLDLDLPSAPPPAAPAGARDRGPESASQPGSSAFELDSASGPRGAREGPAACTGGPGSAGAGWGADGLGDDVDDLRDVGLAIDSVKAPDRRKAPGPPPATAGRPPAGGPGATLPRAAGGAGALAVDPYEVQLLAAYGAVPTSIFATVGYAYRVHRRRRELRALYEQATESHVRRRRVVQEQYARLVEEARGELGGELDDELRLLLRPLDEAQQLIQTRSAQLEATSEQYSAQAAQLAAELGQRAGEQKALLGERNAAQILLEDCLAKQRQCQSDLSRVEGQLQAGLEDAARVTAADVEFAPPAQARKLAELQGQRARLVEDLKRHDRAVAAAKDHVAVHDRALRELDRRVSDIHGRKRQLGEQAAEAHELRREGIRQAEQQRLDAHELVLRQLVTAHPSRFGADRGATVARLDAELKDSATSVERHRLAVDAYDDPAYKRGIAIAVVACCLLVVVVVALARL